MTISLRRLFVKCASIVHYCKVLVQSTLRNPLLEPHPHISFSLILSIQNIILSIQNINF
jgi:hypothetical protein